MKQINPMTETTTTSPRANGAVVRNGCNSKTAIKPMNNMLAWKSTPRPAVYPNSWRRQSSRPPMTQTGVIGTFGGLDIPVVTEYLIGFEAGMHYYNQKNDTQVKLLGWDTASDEGYFLNSFSDKDLAARYTMKLIEQGAMKKVL